MFWKIKKDGVSSYHLRQSLRGASLTGYGMVVGLVAVAAIAAVTGVGTGVTNLFDKTSAEMSAASSRSGNTSAVLSMPSGTLAVADITNGLSPGDCTDLPVTNSGTGTATGLKINAFSGTNALNFVSCGGTIQPCDDELAAGETCNFGVSLTASSDGSFTATANISADGGISASRVVSGDASGTTPLYAFSSHTFTNCSRTGSSGPTLGQCQSAYSSESWASNTSHFNITTQGVQEWTVPASGTYQITTIGARGGIGRDGGFPGRGAQLSGEFVLVRGDVIHIAVGQMGSNGTNFAGGGGGGGGSFVVDASDNPLIIAGGGGGGRHFGGIVDARATVTDATTTESGRDGGNAEFGPNAPAGTGGSGGTAGRTQTQLVGAGGGGLGGDGENGHNSSGLARGGLSFINGCTGGTTSSAGGGLGGFGGGGSGEGNWCGAAGGGGGYNGGGGDASYCCYFSGSPCSGGSPHSTPTGGGGGGSYNGGSNTSASEGVGTGHGSVVITKL